MLVVRIIRKKATIEKSVLKEMKTCGTSHDWGKGGGEGIDRGKRLATKTPSQHAKKKKKTRKAKVSKAPPPLKSEHKLTLFNPTSHDHLWRSRFFWT
jgi:hypothetical protein